MTRYQQGFLSACSRAGLSERDSLELLKTAEADPNLARASAIFKDWLTVPKHTVRRAETLAGIARKYNVKIDDIMKENGITSIAGVKPGQQLRIPVSTKVKA